MKLIKELLFLGLIMICLDYFYLNATKHLFNSVVKNIQGSNIKLKYNGAFLTYILMIFTIYYFIIQKKGTYIDSFILGFCIYGVFELTNYTIFNKWRPELVILELLWGGILFSTTHYLFILLNSH